jgi:hypothetical protein
MMKKNVSPPAFPYLLVTSPDTFYLQFYTWLC